MPRYTRAPEVEEIATVLIDRYHPHLHHARILYLFTDREKKIGDKHINGSVSKLCVCAAYLARSMRPDWDAGEDEPVFKMEIVLPRWSAASDRLKHAIVDHELRHLQTNSKGKLIVVPHTLEEFPEIIERWGFYLEDRRHFEEVCAAALQRVREGLASAGELARREPADRPELELPDRRPTIPVPAIPPAIVPVSAVAHAPPESRCRTP